MSNVIDKLKAALQLSEQMLAAASDEQWSTITDLQNKRKVVLDTVFPIQNNEDTEQVRTLIENIIDLNQKLELVCRQARQSVQTELTGLNKNKKAVAAYKSS